MRFLHPAISRSGEVIKPMSTLWTNSVDFVGGDLTTHLSSSLQTLSTNTAHFTTLPIAWYILKHIGDRMTTHETKPETYWTIVVCSSQIDRSIDRLTNIIIGYYDISVSDNCLHHVYSVRIKFCLHIVWASITIGFARRSLAPVLSSCHIPGRHQQSSLMMSRSFGLHIRCVGKFRTHALSDC